MAKKELSLDTKLKDVLRAYRDSFSMKTYSEENDELDPLMDVFGITPDQKRENRQYWGRELGMCWQLLVTNVLSHHCKEYAPAIKIGDDEPCDCRVGTDAIDTKYRIGSGDSGTLKKFKSYGKLLKEREYRPVLLIVREDNLRAAVTACNRGGWTVFQGQATFDYIKDLSGFDLFAWLGTCKQTDDFFINRT
ncbi:MAG TPA: hypothetical protein VN688_10495 [Gemmataceae bacterium]|nr:hypothetical protein [Gemmataceae bacterium]